MAPRCGWQLESVLQLPRWGVLALQQLADLLQAPSALTCSSQQPFLRCYATDKNQDDAALAEERFKEIQNAYEILSDPHERSWWGPGRLTDSLAGWLAGRPAGPAGQEYALCGWLSHAS